MSSKKAKMSNKTVAAYIADKTGYSVKTVRIILQSLTEAIPALLTTTTNRVNIWSLGTFELRWWTGRKFSPDKTLKNHPLRFRGEIAGRYRVKFTPSDHLKNAVQASTQRPLPQKSGCHPSTGLSK